MDRFDLRSADRTLVLSAPTSADIDRIAEICVDPEIQRFTTVPSPYTRGDAANFVAGVVPEGWQKGAPTWAIRAVADGESRLVGMVDLHDVAHGRGEIGFWMAPDARGNGHLSRAIGLVLDAAFGRLGLVLVHWRADVGNWASWRAVWRHGFRKEGTVRGLNVTRGELKDAWVGSLHKDDPRSPVAPWDGPETTAEPAAAVGSPSSRDPEALVRQFHDTYALPVVTDPPSVDRDRVHMRMALVAEELAELVEAVYGEAAGAEISAAFTRAVAADDGTRDTVEAADALGDLTYVIYGMALECGIPLEDVLAEIQASNLSKLGQDGKPIYREDGKVLKGPGFFPPDIAGVLARHGYRPPSRG
ncbi:bifunctional GNAT family N-acetyltransferase/nucleoside triphosphate pyrophosphohydrolase family protein [Georgenia sp. EYE_87]|uniref:bifunctional GNAT family N-acetyltransferase/nucleoside triphosphate pyrophosphohydrolase family protein n=1 Tax=Georgenia sp. EYE_87 TaxID=2853448 RepID=UPI002004AFAD|nr:bifunctional GNAT family N-acetyltransferase/nucleoside triphosphate pyrophosphohydrolase family protein [Georgenia sp. EYE_87]